MEKSSWEVLPKSCIAPRRQTQRAATKRDGTYLFKLVLPPPRFLARLRSWHFCYNKGNERIENRPRADQIFLLYTFNMKLWKSRIGLLFVIIYFVLIFLISVFSKIAFGNCQGMVCLGIAYLRIISLPFFFPIVFLADLFFSHHWGYIVTTITSPFLSAVKVFSAAIVRWYILAVILNGAILYLIVAVIERHIRRRSVQSWQAGELPPEQ